MFPPSGSPALRWLPTPSLCLPLVKAVVVGVRHSPRSTYADSTEAPPCPSGLTAVHQTAQLALGRQWEIPLLQTLMVIATRIPASLTLSRAAEPHLKGKGVYAGGGASERQALRTCPSRVPHLEIGQDQTHSCEQQHRHTTSEGLFPGFS